jgi:hypothetical protein
MTLELSDTERKLLLAALEVYRRVKGAEGKLTEQRCRSVDIDGPDIRARYQRLHDLNVALQERLQAGS